VRPVAEGTDVGIDLFCETVDTGSRKPFLHFWVQVKGGKQVSVANAKAKCVFEAEHVNYWARQPVPVYAFLVPEDQLHDLKTVYVVSFVRKMMKQEVPIAGHGTRTLETDLVYNTSGDLWNLNTFVDTSVKLDHMLMHIRQGVSAPWPQLSTDYVQSSIKGYRAPYADHVADQVRRSASATMTDLLDLPQLTAEQKRRLAVLADVLRPFTQGICPEGYWQQHWEDYVAMGRWFRLAGDRAVGDKYVRRAIEIIQGDETFKTACPQWQDYVVGIEELLAQE